VTGLKVIVVAMGVAILAGFTVLFVRWAEHHPGTFDPGLASGPTPAATAAEAMVDLPPGARVVQVAPAGPLVDVLVERPDGTWDLMQVRRADGSVAGTLRLTPAPAPPAP
jgi:hypothetical protein